MISTRTLSFGVPLQPATIIATTRRVMIHARRDRSPGGGTIRASVPPCHGWPRSRYGRCRSASDAGTVDFATRGARGGSRRTAIGEALTAASSRQASMRQHRDRRTGRGRRRAPPSNGLPTTPRRCAAASVIARSKRSRAVSRSPIATWASPAKCVANPITTVPRPTVIVRSPRSSSRDAHHAPIAAS